MSKGAAIEVVPAEALPQERQQWILQRLRLQARLKRRVFAE